METTLLKSKFAGKQPVGEIEGLEGRCPPKMEVSIESSCGGSTTVDGGGPGGVFEGPAMGQCSKGVGGGVRNHDLGEGSDGRRSSGFWRGSDVDDGGGLWMVQSGGGPGARSVPGSAEEEDTVLLGRVARSGGVRKGSDDDDGGGLRMIKSGVGPVARAVPWSAGKEGSWEEDDGGGGTNAMTGAGSDEEPE